MGLLQKFLPFTRTAFKCTTVNLSTTRMLTTTPRKATTIPKKTPSSYHKHLTATQFFTSKTPFKTFYGDEIPEVTVAYETWGELNEKKDNTILLHTGLSASAHAKSSNVDENHGWWEEFIGPGLTLDTDKFHVICCNVLGGCFGSTGPSSIDPRTGTAYASNFPVITVDDMVKSQFLLLDHLGIDVLHASVGASMGGMQSLAASALFPDRIKKLVTISACCESHPLSIASRFAQRSILMDDSVWNNGFYYNDLYPEDGMKNARLISTITYRSGPEWELRFGNRRENLDQTPSPFQCDFEIDHYLKFKAASFCYTYDPNSLLYISKAMDLFNIGNGFKSMIHGCARIKCPTLVIGVQSDILFPVQQQKDIVRYLRASRNPRVTYVELDAIYGHDTFLLDVINVGTPVKGHLELQCK